RCRLKCSSYLFNVSSILKMRFGSGSAAVDVVDACRRWTEFLSETLEEAARSGSAAYNDRDRLEVYVANMVHPVMSLAWIRSSFPWVRPRSFMHESSM